MFYAARLPNLDSEARRAFKWGFFGGLGLMSAGVAVWLALWLLLFIACGAFGFLFSRPSSPARPPFFGF